MLLADSFNQSKLKTFWKAMSVLQTLTFVLGIIKGAMKLGWGDNEGGGEFIGACIGLGLACWYIWAVKVLGERIGKGEISAQDPSGHAAAVGAPTGVQLAPVAAVPVHAVAVPVSAQPATAVAVAVTVVPEKAA